MVFFSNQQAWKIISSLQLVSYSLISSFSLFLFSDFFSVEDLFRWKLDDSLDSSMKDLLAEEYASNPHWNEDYENNILQLEVKENKKIENVSRKNKKSFFLSFFSFFLFFTHFSFFFPKKRAKRTASTKINNQILIFLSKK